MQLEVLDNSKFKENKIEKTVNWAESLSFTNKRMNEYQQQNRAKKEAHSIEMTFLHSVQFFRMQSP